MEPRPRWDPGALARRGVSGVYRLARFVRIEHTLFSLPFAYAGAVLAPAGLSLRVAVLIFTALLGLRTAGMSFNNIADRDIDALNPRTRLRPLITGEVRLWEAWLLVALGSLLYFVSAALLNWYALLLSPIVYAVAMTYPYAKRIHWLPHLHLGLVLGLTVFGGYVAAYGCVARSLWEVVSTAPWLLTFSVTLWVAGFDTVYAIMDEEFDRRYGLGSIPARWGTGAALAASGIMHWLSAVLYYASLTLHNEPPVAWLVGSAGVALLAYQHYLLSRRGLEAIPKAFNLNLAAGPLMALGVIAGWAWGILPWVHH